ncbi:MAG: hypothetical protein Q8P05_05335 [Candidatus Diapherotrites archaeon]|nr:hypothetical protein [Candidatus Diapherotrites archaeon]
MTSSQLPFFAKEESNNMKFRINQKGQSALEYLMTYGWALVVIVIAVAALVVLINPSTIQGNQCDSRFGQFTVSQSNITADTTDFVLVNQTGQGVTLQTLDITGRHGGGTTYAQTAQLILGIGPGSLAPNESKIVTLDQDPNLASGSYDLVYSFTYDAGQLTGLAAGGGCRGTI